MHESDTVKRENKPRNFSFSPEIICLKKGPNTIIMSLLSALAISFIMIFVAELGDKSQFMAILFGLRYPRRTVLLGISVAAIIITFLAVILGKVLLTLVSPKIMDIFSILIMLFFSLQTVISQESMKNNLHSQKSTRLAWLTVSLTFIAAELGDKTMFTAANLTLKYSPWIVWIGAVAGLIISNSLVLLIDKSVLKKIKLINLKFLAGFAFILFTLWQSAALEISWTVKILIMGGEIILFILVLFRRMKRANAISPVFTILDATEAENTNSPTVTSHYTA